MGTIEQRSGNNGVLSAASIRDSTGVDSEKLFTKESIEFLLDLHKRFNPRRLELLAERSRLQALYNSGNTPDFLTETKSIRDSNWQVAPCPSQLNMRHVEITGPAEPKMIIQALNSGADVFMADIEDSLSPSWRNILQAQIALRDAVTRTLSFTSKEGKIYKLNAQIAELLVRPRGWHLAEKNFQASGESMSASLFDFGLYFFLNAKELSKQGKGMFLYLPKLESYLEARLWNDVFDFAEKTLGFPKGFIRVTVLIETLPAAFQMDEILFELKDHICGLNAGRWDYIFSFIKKRSLHRAAMLPDRKFVTMGTPPMSAYAMRLVHTCHKRGAHAMGGMSAFIPSRKDADVTRAALGRVTQDKTREASLGFDGSWVAHPDLVGMVKNIFVTALGSRPHQKDRDLGVMPESKAELIDFSGVEGVISEEGVRTNIEVALIYIERWLAGVGAVAIHHLMEDAATAEISRAQLWQWVKHGAVLSNGLTMTRELYIKIAQEEMDKLLISEASGGATSTLNRYQKAKEILDQLILNSEFQDFLTVSAYECL